jgi:Flp pilus assembly protein TadG
MKSLLRNRLRHPLTVLDAIIRRLLRSDRGSVMIEFVIIVPLMLLVLLGFTELYMYMRAVSIVEHTAFVLADSIGQMPQILNDNSTSSVNNLGSLWSAAMLLAAPNTLSSQGGVIVTSVCDKAASTCNPITPCVPSAASPQSLTAATPKIYWQATAPWNSNVMTTQVTSTSILPPAWPFRTGDSAIIVEVFYSYTPFAMTSVFWKTAPGVQTIYERVYARTRSGQPLELCPAL